MALKNDLRGLLENGRRPRKNIRPNRPTSKHNFYVQLFRKLNSLWCSVSVAEYFRRIFFEGHHRIILPQYFF